MVGSWDSKAGTSNPVTTLESHERPSYPIDEIVIYAADGQRHPSSAPGDMHA
jgi:hypothetical protein